MAVIDSLLGANITLQVPPGGAYLTITHETYQQEPYSWIDNVKNNSAPAYPMNVDLDANLLSVTGTTYIWQPFSTGSYEIQWFDINMLPLPAFNLFYGIYEQFIQQSSFFNDYPQYSNQATRFNSLERKVRRIISAFCDQDFQPWINKCVKLQGQGGNSLTLSKPLLNIKNVIDMFAYDITQQCQSDPESEYSLVKSYSDTTYIREQADGFLYDVDVKKGVFEFERRFNKDVDYYITGDFGSYFVPEDVTEAAKMLIADEYSGVNDLRNHGIGGAKLADYAYTIESLAAGTASTGNIQADLLLQEYTNQMNVRLI